MGRITMVAQRFLVGLAAISMLSCGGGGEDAAKVSFDVFPTIVINADRTFDVGETEPLIISGASFAFQFGVTNESPDQQAYILGMKVEMKVITEAGGLETSTIDIGPPTGASYLLRIPPNGFRRYGWTDQDIPEPIGSDDIISPFTALFVASLPKRARSYQALISVEGVLGNPFDPDARNLFLQKSVSISSGN